VFSTSHHKVLRLLGVVFHKVGNSYEIQMTVSNDYGIKIKYLQDLFKKLPYNLRKVPKWEWWDFFHPARVTLCKSLRLEIRCRHEWTRFIISHID
jgi:hypothetical protein